MKKLAIVLLILILVAGWYFYGKDRYVSKERFDQLNTITMQHIQLRNTIILELIIAKTEKEKQEVIKKYGITITQPNPRG